MNTRPYTYVAVIHEPMVDVTEASMSIFFAVHGWNQSEVKEENNGNNEILFKEKENVHYGDCSEMTHLNWTVETVKL